MKLYHFGLSLMFAMPVLAETPSQPSLLETTALFMFMRVFS